MIRYQAFQQDIERNGLIEQRLISIEKQSVVAQAQDAG